MCKDRLRHRVRTVGRYVGHGNTMTGCGLNIHHIIACCQHTNVSQGRQVIHDVGIQNRFVCNQYFGSLRPFQHLFRPGAVINLT